MDTKNWHSTQKAIDTLPNNKQVKGELEGLLSLLESLSSIACKSTHYEHLNDWSDRVYDYVRLMLKHNKFKNGDVAANNKNPGARFWFNMYCMVGDIIYSPNLQSEVAPHHSSAYSRNEAFKAEVKIILDKAIKLTI